MRLQQSLNSTTKSIHGPSFVHLFATGVVGNRLSNIPCNTETSLLFKSATSQSADMYTSMLPL